MDIAQLCAAATGVTFAKMPDMPVALYRHMACWMMLCWQHAELSNLFCLKTCSSW